MFGKRVADLRRDDVERIVKEELQEGQDLELKEVLSDENGLPDPWMAGALKIGKYARDRLLDKVVACANTFGGTLVLGIAETDEKPPPELPKSRRFHGAQTLPSASSFSAVTVSSQDCQDSRLLV